jgi:hypothetical protein
MPNRVARWLVRHHPTWWRRRYQDEMLALIEQNPPDLEATVDLARSCAREWGACRLGEATVQRSMLLRWLLALRFVVQVPLAVLVLIVIGATTIQVVGSMLLGQSLAGSLPRQLVHVWPFVGPVFASGVVVISSGVTARLRQRPVVVSLASVVAAVLALAIPFAVIVATNIQVRDVLGDDGIRGAMLRERLVLLVAYALAVGLVVREAFRGLPLTRCVINCWHGGPSRTGQTAP